MSEPMTREGAIIWLEDVADLIKRFRALGGTAVGQMLESNIECMKLQGADRESISDYLQRRVMAFEFAAQHAENELDVLLLESVARILRRIYAGSASEFGGALDLTKEALRLSGFTEVQIARPCRVYLDAINRTIETLKQKGNKEDGGHNAANQHSTGVMRGCER